MLNVPGHGPTRPEPLLRSIKRHLYAENCSARTPHHLLIAVWQADTFLRGRGTSVHAPPGPTSRRSWACSSARACSARAGSRDGCAASSSSARSLGPPALPWVPLTGRRPRPRTSQAISRSNLDASRATGISADSAAACWLDQASAQPTSRRATSRRPVPGSAQGPGGQSWIHSVCPVGAAMAAATSRWAWVSWSGLSSAARSSACVAAEALSRR